MTRLAAGCDYSLFKDGIRPILFNWLTRLAAGYDYSLFKEGIRPMWEDERLEFV